MKTQAMRRVLRGVWVCLWVVGATAAWAAEPSPDTPPVEALAGDATTLSETGASFSHGSGRAAVYRSADRGDTASRVDHLGPAWALNAVDMRLRTHKE